MKSLEDVKEWLNEIEVDLSEMLAREQHDKEVMWKKLRKEARSSANVPEGVRNIAKQSVVNVNMALGTEEVPELLRLLAKANPGKVTIKTLGVPDLEQNEVIKDKLATLQDKVRWYAKFLLNTKLVATAMRNGLYQQLLAQGVSPEEAGPAAIHMTVNVPEYLGAAMMAYGLSGQLP